ncbi:MAG: radical SAM protein [Promethearchaeota archaeon]
MGCKFVKGVKEDSRFGKVLSVNFNPFKVCNFNCVYCGTGPTTDKTIERREFYPPGEIFREIREYIELKGEPDYVWVTGFGEPTLYASFKQFSMLIKRVYPNIKIGISTNGSLLSRKEVRDDCSLCDLMLIEIVSVFPDEFTEICRQHEDIYLEDLIEGVKVFRKTFRGELIIVSVFLEGINDNQKSLLGLKKLISELQPTTFLLKNYACRGYKSLNGEFKKLAQNIFNDLPIEVIYKI